MRSIFFASMLAAGVSAGGLHDAIQKRDPAAARTALAKGANVNEYDSRGRTPLTLAALGKQLPIIELLVSKGADVNKAEKSNGFTPLHWSGSSPEVIRFLLKSRANPTILNAFGQTPLHTCHNLEAAQLFVKARVPHDKTDKHGSPPLSTQAAAGSSDVLDLILSLGAKVNGHGRVVPLIQAAHSGRLPNIERLLAAGADVAARDTSGRTALHLAGAAEVATALLAAGASPAAKDKSGLTAVQGKKRDKDIARASAIIAALKKAPARVAKPPVIPPRAPATVAAPTPTPADNSALRTWTDRRGKTVHARLISRDGAGIVLQRQNGNTLNLHKDQLSDRDRSWLLQQAGTASAISLTPQTAASWQLSKGNPGFAETMKPAPLVFRGPGPNLIGQDDQAFDLTRTLPEPWKDAELRLAFRPTEVFPRSGSVTIFLRDSASKTELKCFFPAGHYKGALTVSRDGRELRTQAAAVSYAINMPHGIALTFRAGTLAASLDKKPIYSQSQLELPQFDSVTVRINQMTAQVSKLEIIPLRGALSMRTYGALWRSI